MDETVRVVTELRLRREAQEIDRGILVARLQLRCEEAGGLDTRTIRDWEDRGHTPSAVYRAALCAYFQVDSVAELGLGPGLEAAANWTWTSPTQRLIEVQRRQLLRLTVSGLGAGLLPVPPLVAAAQMLGGRRRLEPAALDTAQQVATHLTASRLSTLRPQVARAAQAHVYTLLDLLKRASMTPEVRARLEAVAADQACLVGDLCLDAGEFALGHAWLAEALRLARQAGDRRREAYALGCHPDTHIYGPQPNPVAALEALEAAAALHLLLPPEGQAWLFAKLARARAAAGDDLGSGRLLERARAAAARVRRDGAGWGYVSAHGVLSGYDSVRIEGSAGKRLLQLGRPAEAVESLEAAISGTTVPVRRHQLWVDLTDVGVALGDPDRACASAVAGLDEADRHGLGIFEVRRARAAFPRYWGSLAPVMELDDRLALTN